MNYNLKIIRQDLQDQLDIKVFGSVKNFKVDQRRTREDGQWKTEIRVLTPDITPQTMERLPPTSNLYQPKVRTGLAAKKILLIM